MIDMSSLSIIFISCEGSNEKKREKMIEEGKGVSKKKKKRRRK